MLPQTIQIDRARRGSFDGGSQPRTLAATLGLSLKAPLFGGSTKQIDDHEHKPSKTSFGRDGGVFRVTRRSRLKSLATRFVARSRRK